MPAARLMSDSSLSQLRQSVFIQNLKKTSDGGELVLGLFLSVSLLALDLNFGLLLIELHELGQIELGLLEELDLADEDVLEGEDLLALLNDLFA